MSNPIIEAWRAKQDQLKGQTEGQVAGVTLVMINSVFQQIQHEFAEAKQIPADIKSTLLVAQNELKNANEIIPQSIQKALKSGQDQMREVGIEVKTQIGEACQRVEDINLKIEQAGDKIHQSITPVVAHLDDLNRTWSAVDFTKIEEIPKSIVRLEKRTEDVKKDIQNTQATAIKGRRIFLSMIGVLVASFIGFCVAFFVSSAVDKRLWSENSELKEQILDLKEKNGQWQLAFAKQKSLLEEANKEVSFSQSFELWLVHGDEARLRDFKFTYQSELNKQK